jgi:hypothetical protein
MKEGYGLACGLGGVKYFESIVVTKKFNMCFLGGNILPFNCKIYVHKIYLKAA